MPRYAPESITEIFRVKVTTTYVGPAGTYPDGFVSVGYYGPYTSLSAALGMATRRTYRSYLFDYEAVVEGATVGEWETVT